MTAPRRRADELGEAGFWSARRVRGSNDAANECEHGVMRAPDEPEQLRERLAARVDAEEPPKPQTGCAATE